MLSLSLRDVILRAGVYSVFCNLHVGRKNERRGKNRQKKIEGIVDFVNDMYTCTPADVSLGYCAPASIKYYTPSQFFVSLVN